MELIDFKIANNKDIERIMEIENESFLAPYNKDELIYELNGNPVSVYLLVTINDYVVGFIDYWITFDSATIAQIAIDKRYQNRGLAKALIKEMINDCYAKKVQTITLEVRTHNVRAIHLYKKMGFKETLIKKKYYTNGDDALYMLREVN